MKPIKLIITLLFCAFTTGVFSQPVDLNKEKYDTYRNNLKYFVVVGEGPKRSILAERRNDKGNCGPTCLTFGDGGIMQGWYVGMLATEYARLKKESKPTQQTLNELYCALLALERLDAVAGAQNNYNNNYLPPCPYYTGVPDGISVRTDGWDDADCFNNTPFYDAINGGLQNIYPSPSYNVQWSDIDNLERQFKDQSTNHDYFSIDQLTHVMMGLYLTYHYVDDGTHSVTCGSGNAQVNFEKYAANMMVRYIDKLHQWGYILHKPDGSPISATNGGWAQNFAKPFIYLHNKVSLVLNHPPKTITPTVKSLWKQTWAVLSLNPKADLYHMQLATATISDENFVYTPFTSTADAIMSASEKYNWEYFYPLLHNNLYGSSPMSDEYYCKVQNELDKAPPSNPENNGINPNDGPEGWRCHLKFTKTIEEQDSGYHTDNHGDKYLSFTAKFSGIDYMLQYNLYQ
ncbi:MAG: hypothetical protein JKX68_02770 [Flavobacteriales bacterium]|nr:hypothetical protein [Flavobacteriales bacterium]